MTFTNEDAVRIKEHLLTQLENFPEDRREQIKNQIESMTNEQVEAFVEQNKLTHLTSGCIFCSIAKGDTQSYKIGENDSNIAILELNPLSRGHSLIIPIEHKNGITETTKELAQKISEKIQEKFRPKIIDKKETSIMGHPLIQIIPIYNEPLERHQATEDELKELQEEILKEDIPKTPQKLEEAQTEIPKLRPRMP